MSQNFYITVIDKEDILPQTKLTIFTNPCIHLSLDDAIEALDLLADGKGEIYYFETHMIHKAIK